MFYRVVVKDFQFVFSLGEHSHPNPPPHKVDYRTVTYIRSELESSPVLSTKEFKNGVGVKKASRLHVALTNVDKLTQTLNRQRHILYGDNSGNIRSMFHKLALNIFQKEKPRYMCNQHEVNFIDPYVRNEHITEMGLEFVQLQSPLMSALASSADYLVGDVKHKEGLGIDLHLLNICFFNEKLEKSVTVYRCLIGPDLTGDAYYYGFLYFFQTLTSDGYDAKAFIHQLKAMIFDFSDAQINGFIRACATIDPETGKQQAQTILKGCQVYFVRNGSRVAKLVGRTKDEEDYIIKILQSIPHAKTKEETLKLFNHIKRRYPGTASFVDWWVKDRRLAMLCRSFTRNKHFNCVPHTSNMIEQEHSQIEREKPKNSSRKTVTLTLWNRDSNLFDMVFTKGEGINLTGSVQILHLTPP